MHRPFSILIVFLFLVGIAPQSILAFSERSNPAPIWKTQEHFSNYCHEALKKALVERNALLNLKPDLSSADALDVFEKVNNLMISLDDCSGWSHLINEVHPDQCMQEVAAKWSQDIELFATQTFLDPNLYAVIASAIKHIDIDNESLYRFGSKLLLDFQMTGATKDLETRKRIQAIQEELVKLSQDYSRNLREDRRYIKVDPIELQGLPADWIAAHPVDALGLVTIWTDTPDFIPCQEYADSSSLRKTLYETYLQRGYPKNEEVLIKVLYLRHELANLLDHPDYASYMAQDKMVKTSERVEDFIYQLESAITPTYDKEISELSERKKQENEDSPESSDRFYYTRKIKEERYSIDKQAMRPYFAYEKVKNGILELYAELFQLDILPVLNEPVWHPSVEAYEVLSNGEKIAQFYLDMHPRENKFGHAAMFNIQTGLCSGRLPSASLVCNFPNPAEGDGKALMEHSDVVTFFHEFGHLVHHLLARKSKWISLGGINVEWDFVEAPSQLLEEWAWNPQILQRFAKHIDTGEKIPAKFVENLRASENFGKGTHLMRQLFLTAYSFFLHQRDPNLLNLTEFSNEMYARWSPYPRMENTYLYTSFGHLIGYSSMYYTYQWSLVIAKDLFSRFQSEGLLNPQTAKDYREAILEPGGESHAEDLITKFLGRPHNLDAYIDWLNQ